MNLTELYRRRQISVGMAAAAATPEARLSHHGLAAGYAARIKSFDSGAEERFSATRVLEQLASRRAVLLPANEDASDVSPMA